jgi:alginate O-acetyltransferase complex protein AlgI
MPPSTTPIALYLVVVLSASWLLRPRARAWRLFLVGASAVLFLEPWSIRPDTAGRTVQALLALGAIVLGAHATARAVSRAPAPGALVAGFVAVAMIVLVWSRSGARLTPAPIGLSILVLVAIAYVVDVARGDQPPVSLLDTAVHLTFFPHVLAGPVLRVRDLAPQLAERVDPRRVATGEGFPLLLRGLFKTFVVSGYLAAHLTGPVLDEPDGYPRSVVAVAIAGLAVQVYAALSGYLDIASGVALLLGFRFPASFDAPFRAHSLTDFWHRWNLTLARWFRDYVYVPLGGSRGGAARASLALMATMVTGGLWLGLRPTLVAWGLLHGAVLAVERYLRPRLPALPPVPAAVLGGVVTVAVVGVGWVLLAARDLGAAGAVFVQLVMGSGSADAPNPVTPLVALVIAGTIAVQFVPAAPGRRIVAAATTAPALVQVALGAVALLVIGALAPGELAPFFATGI